MNAPDRASSSPSAPLSPLDIESTTHDLITCLVSGNEHQVQHYMGNILLKGFSGNVLERFCAEFMSSPVSQHVVQDSIKHACNNIGHVNTCIYYRQLSNETLQSLCEINEIAFLWEFDRSSKRFRLVLKKVMFADSDDDIYISTRPWKASLQEARTDFLLCNNTERDFSGGNGISNTLLGLSAYTNHSSIFNDHNESGDSSEMDDPIEDDDAYWNKYSEVDVF